MFFIIFLIVIITISLIYLGYLIFRRLPDLKNLDVSSIAEERQDEAKTKILQAKFSRQSQQIKKKINQLLSPHKNFFSSKLQRIKEQFSELEVQYQNGNDGKISAKPKDIKQLLKEAEEFINKNDFVSAEKNLIEIISLDEKNVQAYEMLGNLYFEIKNYNQAEETFKYLLRLKTFGQKRQKRVDSVIFKNGRLQEAEINFLNSLEIDPKVATYYDDLGQIYEITEKFDKALDCYLKATAIEPNNPKYLDKLTQLSIEAGDKGLARRTFNRLKEINPENGKLNDFKEAIEKI